MTSAGNISTNGTLNVAATTIIGEMLKIARYHIGSEPACTADNEGGMVYDLDNHAMCICNNAGTWKNPLTGDTCFAAL